MVGGDPIGQSNYNINPPDQSGESLEDNLPQQSDQEQITPIKRLGDSIDKIRALLENNPSVGPEAIEALKALKAEMTEEMERLQYESTHDYLTGLNNRRAFFDIVSSRLAEFYNSNESPKEQSPGSLVFMDLNGFKKINTELGNIPADEVLVKFASLSKHLRKKGVSASGRSREEDVSARLGGDEIVIYLPDSNPEIVAKIIARRVAKILVDNPIIVDGKKIDITFAVGSMALPSKLEIPVDTDQKQFLIELINQSLNEAQTREQKAKDVTGHDSIAVSYPDSRTGKTAVMSEAELFRWRDRDDETTDHRRAQDTELKDEDAILRESDLSKQENVAKNSAEVANDSM